MINLEFLCLPSFHLHYVIFSIYRSTVGKAQKEKHAKMAKYSKLYTDDIDQILEKGGKNWYVEL